MAAAKKPTATPSADRAFDAFQARMEKSYGPGKFKMSNEVVPYDVISTGSIVLDYYMVVGGWVVGRQHELWGPEGAGKTTMALISCRMAQAKDLTRRAAYLDVEHRLDRAWAVAHGVDLSRLVHVKPDNAEEVADMLKDMCRSGLFSFIVVDSVGAMLPDKAKDKDAADSVMGKEAQVITRMVKICASEAANSNTTVLYLNQVRANFGYGSDTTTPGGFALKHGTSSKLQIKRAGGSGADTSFKVKIDGEDRIVGHQLAVQIQRNSVAPAYRTAHFPMLYIPTEKYGAVGIDRADEAVTIGLKTGVIQQGGAWYTITVDGQRLNGRDAVVAAVRASPTLADDIRERALSTVTVAEETDASKIWEADEQATAAEEAS